MTLIRSMRGSFDFMLYIQNAQWSRMLLFMLFCILRQRRQLPCRVFAEHVEKDNLWVHWLSLVSEIQ